MLLCVKVPPWWVAVVAAMPTLLLMVVSRESPHVLPFWSDAGLFVRCFDELAVWPCLFLEWSVGFYEYPYGICAVRARQP